jgi:hypothetical protein
MTSSTSKLLFGEEVLILSTRLCRGAEKRRTRNPLATQARSFQSMMLLPLPRRLLNLYRGLGFLVSAICASPPILRPWRTTAPDKRCGLAGSTCALGADQETAVLPLQIRLPPHTLFNIPMLFV